MQTMTGMRKDFVASHLRSQYNRLRSVIQNIENDDMLDGYAQESLKQIEFNLRHIRKLCEHN